MKLKKAMINELQEDRVPVSYWISKQAEETLYYYSEKLNLEEDQVLTMLLYYMGITDNIEKFMNDIQE